MYACGSLASLKTLGSQFCCGLASLRTGVTSHKRARTALRNIYQSFLSARIEETGYSFAW